MKEPVRVEQLQKKSKEESLVIEVSIMSGDEEAITKQVTEAIEDSHKNRIYEAKIEGIIVKLCYPKFYDDRATQFLSKNAQIEAE